VGRFIVKVGPGMSTLVSLRYPGFGVRVRVVSSCLLVFTDGCNSIILFCFLAIDNDIMRKMCTLITRVKVQTSTKILLTKIMLPVLVHRNRGILNSLLYDQGPLSVGTGISSSRLRGNFFSMSLFAATRTVQNS
jgi:hypothetical protein